MTVFKIQLITIEDVRKFVTNANMQMCDADVVSGRYTIDAKSLLGIFSLDLSKPVEVQVHGTGHDAERFKEAIRYMIVEE
ncbi:MAG: HPr family phosphocarrier protein [Oscillospiraceae bacterium]|nr:HPr family phosphocarrier protein [Oscillospiraceae bacterium]